MTKILVCNWKMNGSLEYCEQVNKFFQEKKFKTKIVVAPPSPLLSHLDRDTGFFLGAQNCYSEPDGSYTGEVSAKILRDVGVKYVILGHSERRKYFAETSDLILKKIGIVIENKMIPIICVRRFTEDSQYIKLIQSSLICSSLEEIIIAYEPDSAIGSGVSDSIDSIEENYSKIAESFKHNQIKPKILYGGSVNSENIKNIAEVCDGILLGKASLDIKEIDKIVATLDLIS
jgi:triosephosphate isomerase